MNAPVEHVEPVDTENAVNIPHGGAVDAAAAGTGMDGTAQPLADDRPVFHLAKYIRHINVPLLKALDGPGNHIADFARAMAPFHQAGP